MTKNDFCFPSLNPRYLNYLGCFIMKKDTTPSLEDLFREDDMYGGLKEIQLKNAYNQADM